MLAASEQFDKGLGDVPLWVMGPSLPCSGVLNPSYEEFGHSHAEALQVINTDLWEHVCYFGRLHRLRYGFLPHDPADVNDGPNEHGVDRVVVETADERPSIFTKSTGSILR